MPTRLLSPALLLVLASAPAARAQPPLPPGDRAPLLRVEAGGPTSFVTALAFSADGTTLYAAGWDKVVRVWSLTDQGRFAPDRVAAYRVPIGPGDGGALNALALSEDGVWLAAAGSGVSRDAAGFRQEGIVLPTAGTLTPEMRRDLGTLYVFNTRDQTVRLLRGHEDVVESLAFAPPRAGKPPLLLSAARERPPRATTFRTVVRLWDVASAQALAVLDGLPEAVRPGLALWHTGNEPRQVRAALALGDGSFRVWDAAQPDSGLRSARVPRFGVTVAHLPDPGRLLTADYGDQRGRLAYWRVTADGAPERDTTPENVERFGAFPRALALVASQADGKPDLAAVVVRLPERGEQYRLQLVDLRPESLGTVRAEEVLWQGGARMPVLAASPRGQYLAVAGNADHEVRVYAIASLLRRDGAAPQRLRSNGVTFRHVAFAARGNDLALVLNTAGRKAAGQAPPALDPAQGDLLFDFANRRLATEAAGWRTAAPHADGWRAQHAAGKDGTTVDVFQGERRVRQVRLPAQEELLDYALLPPRGAVPVPLLALATHEVGKPRLVLVNAATGDTLRHFTGHVDRVHALAFAADGRLLASCAEDQTVCVWSLTDIGRVLGRSGRLAGVALGEEQGAVVVARVEDDSPARGTLRPGDVLAGLVVNGTLQPLARAMAFYEAVYRMPPGARVTLRRGDPRGTDDVTLVVGQGVDERKPLLSLFVLRNEQTGKAEGGEWIGWNPVGPYEASSPRAERSLGWHFNTGDPAQPTRFARADAHRKDYYREGILQKLVAQGALGRVEAPRLPPPVLTLLVQEGDRHRVPAEQGVVAVALPRVTLKLEVRDRPLGSLETLTWKLDDGPEHRLPLDGPAAGKYAVQLDLPRGDHRVEVTAWTRDMPPQPTRRQVALRYQPPPPRVQLEGTPRRVFVHEPGFTVKALVFPGRAGEAVRVALHHWHEERDLLAERATHAIGPDRPLEITKRLELRPGNNLIEIVATNQDAPAGSAAAETDHQVVEAYYVKKARPPVVTLRGVAPAAGGEPQPIAPRRPVVVHTPRVRVVGTLEATEPLVQAEWDRGDGSARAVTGFRPSQARELAVQEEVTLRPGTQTFRLRARTATSDGTESAVTLDYRPLLPEVSLVAPPPGEVLYGEEPTAVVRLQAKVHLPDDPHPYRATVVVQDRETAALLTLDEKSGLLHAAVTVGPGESRLRVRLRNAWGMTADSAETEVRYLRPPRILSLGHGRAGDRPVLDLVARVRSPLPLLREGIRLEVNGHETPAAQVHVGEPEQGVRVVRLEGVPLEAGSKENTIRLRVSNAEAECREPGVLRVETARVLPPPLVEFLQPRQDVSVARPELPVRFQVRSASPLTAVRLLLDGRPPRPIDVTAARSSADGLFELTAQVEVELARGLNHLHVEAVNASGRRVTPPLVATYVPPPLRLVLDRLEPVRPTGQAVVPRKQPGGRVAFPDGVAHGRVRLVGRVLWSDAQAAQAQDDLLVRVFVNGFQQVPVRLRHTGGDPLQTPFEAALILSRERANHVSLVVPGQDAAERTEFDVDCRQPVTGQRLHLFVMSPEKADPDTLKRQILQAIQSIPEAQRLRSPAFEDVTPYGPLTGAQVRPAYIYNQLYNIKTTIDVAQVGAPMNDVVMIYYQGGEAVTERGNFFQTHAGARGLVKEFGIPCDKLVEFLAETPGAHVLLLDVEREAPPGSPGQRGRDKIARWLDDYPQAQAHVGVLRHAWLGKGDPPAEARLLTALGKVIPRSARLREVLAHMGTMFGTLRDSNLLIYTYVPSDLHDLLVGGGQ